MGGRGVHFDNRALFLPSILARELISRVASRFRRSRPALLGILRMGSNTDIRARTRASFRHPASARPFSEEVSDDLPAGFSRSGSVAPDENLVDLLRHKSVERGMLQHRARSLRMRMPRARTIARHFVRSGPWSRRETARFG